MNYSQAGRHTYMQYIHTGIQTYIQAARQVYMHTYVHTYIEKCIHTYIQADIQKETGIHQASTYIHTHAYRKQATYANSEADNHKYG